MSELKLLMLLPFLVLIGTPPEGAQRGRGDHWGRIPIVVENIKSEARSSAGYQFSLQSIRGEKRYLTQDQIDKEELALLDKEETVYGVLEVLGHSFHFKTTPGLLATVSKLLFRINLDERDGDKCNSVYLEEEYVQCFANWSSDDSTASTCDCRRKEAQTLHLQLDTTREVAPHHADYLFTSLGYHNELVGIYRLTSPVVGEGEAWLRLDRTGVIEFGGHPASPPSKITSIWGYDDQLSIIRIPAPAKRQWIDHLEGLDDEEAYLAYEAATASIVWYAYRPHLGTKKREAVLRFKLDKER